MQYKNMRKKDFLAILLSLLVLSFLLVLAFSSSLSSLFSSAPNPEPNLVSDIVQEEGNISVFYCPHEACEQQFLQVIQEAQETLHCALYDLRLSSLKKAFLDKSQFIDVRIVVDEQNIRFVEDFPPEMIRKATGSGLMHNKFCVADGKKVLTGSMNPTENDVFRNNNNLLVISSPSLAENYEQEFQELWQGTFGRGAAVPYPIVQLGNIQIENAFCPDDRCAARIKKELAAAEESIHFMAFSFTHPSIANILLLKHTDGLLVRGVMEARGMDERSQFSRLQYQEIDVLPDGNKNTLHHKVFIIDGKTVITGSMNPTRNGDERNDENILIIRDEAIARRFLEEFESVWAEAGGS